MGQALGGTAPHPPVALERWGQYVGSLTEVPALLRALDVDPAPVLASAGLTFASLARPENRISYAAFGQLFANGAKATGHPLFGLMVGRIYRTESIGLLG